MKKTLTNCLLLVLMVFLVACNMQGNNQTTQQDNEEPLNMLMVVKPEDYLTISRTETEKLCCLHAMETYGDGMFAVMCHSDDHSTQEVFSSPTSLSRLVLFSIEDPENGEFFDIATPGQTLGDVTVTNRAPYEENIVKLSETELLLLFTVRDINGGYYYYSANFDTSTKTVTGYQKLTLDGREWNPDNVAISYNALAEKPIENDGIEEIIFTSRIICHEGAYYGFCGATGAGYSGILVRSTDGINWTSVLIPASVYDMKGVVECGFQFVDNYLYLCMRDISSGVYQCTFDFTTKTQIVETKRIPGVTTSKPATFIKDGELYLIVNKITADEKQVARRNTALFFYVDPATCSFVLTRQVFCGDGISYHQVVEYDGKFYWSFQTDARRLDPFTQGRSNLAFMEVPEMIQLGE